METRRAKIVVLETYVDKRGELISATAQRQIPFDIKRIFWIYGNEYDRGGHAHKACEQFLIAIHNTTVVTVNNVDFMLSSPRYGLYVPVRHKVDMSFDDGAILLVLASEEYDPYDYI